MDRPSLLPFAVRPAAAGEPPTFSRERRMNALCWHGKEDVRADCIKVVLKPWA
jgi:hypothetical protein